MKKILASAAILVAMVSPASAADLYTPEPVPVSEPGIVETNGWYLRGDSSYDFMHLRGASYYHGSNNNRSNFRKTDLNDTGNVGVGVGYQATEHFRVDATFDYMFRTKFRGSTSGGGSNGGACVDSCRSRDIAHLAAYSLMANAYVDIGHYGYFTPYVGAGVGGTRVNWSNLRNTSCNSSNPNDCDDTVTHKGRDSWRFTYALMLGTAIDVTCNVQADLGYRYRHVQGGSMFGYRLNGGPGRDHGLDIHEARAGVRYKFGGCAEQAYMPPADIPAEQPVFK